MHTRLGRPIAHACMPAINITVMHASGQASDARVVQASCILHPAESPRIFNADAGDSLMQMQARRIMPCDEDGLLISWGGTTDHLKCQVQTFASQGVYNHTVGSRHQRSSIKCCTTDP